MEAVIDTNFFVRQGRKPACSGPLAKVSGLVGLLAAKTKGNAVGEAICTELRCVGIKFRKNLCSSRRVIWPE